MRRVKNRRKAGLALWGAALVLAVLAQPAALAVDRQGDAAGWSVPTSEHTFPVTDPTPQPTAAESEAELNMDKDGGNSEASTEFTGTVVATLISVTLPASIPFSMDTTKPFDPTSGKNQAITPTAAQIENRSIVPVVLEVTGMDADATSTTIQNPHPSLGGPTLPFTLVDTVAGVSEPGTAILALRSRGETFGSMQAFERYALTLGRPAGDYPLWVTSVPAYGTAQLEIYGKAASSWEYGHYSFTVVPELKVRVLRSGESEAGA